MIILLIIFSAIIGSFLNMLIYRLPLMLSRENISPLNPKRSICPHCGHTLTLKDLVPIISFLSTKGKCRYCKNKINISYLLVEIISVISTIIIYYFIGLNYELLFFLTLNYALITLFFTDYKHQLLPDIITLPILWLGIIYHLIYGSLEVSVIGAILGYVSLWSVFWLFKLITKKEGMGYGDFKLFALIGAWFTWQALHLIILIAAILGIVYFMIFIRQKNTPFAFGTMLILAIPLYLLIL
jgi:prepilin signal peptidase PulO-like enzyme (type II secretory pathway)